MLIAVMGLCSYEVRGQKFWLLLRFIRVLDITESRRVKTRCASEKVKLL